MAFSNQTPTLLAGIPQALPPQDRALSWACSICFHTLALAVAAVGLRGLPPTPAPVYRMEILLSEAQHDTEQVTATDPQGETEPTAPHETTALTEDSSPIVPASSPPVIQRTAQRITARTPAPQTAEVSSTVSDPFPIESPAPIERQNEPSVSVTESDPPASQSVPEAIEQAEMTSVASSAQEPPAKNFDDHVESSPQHEVSSSPPTDQTPMIDSQTGSSGSLTASPSETVALNHPAISQSVSARSQYEWLMELLRRRIMSFQSYPHLARVQGWEGVVVVKATIDSDGSLIDAVVTKSSGYSALDEDAVRLMHRVCPVHLPQDLGKSKITVLIPIRYRLDKLGS
ncbi:MAG: TonB family protein [Nitrospira sp.]|nr:TonB family protein [Nitrospira sp.]MCP9443374.1 TonB family protein [Nitrospira sp.]